jgi:hypothetical protein
VPLRGLDDKHHTDSSQAAHIVPRFLDPVLESIFSEMKVAEQGSPRYAAIGRARVR